MSSHRLLSTGDHSGVNVNSFQGQDDVAKGEENGTEITHSEQDMNPLEMPLMMEKILSFLDLDSIKNAREVCKLWSAEGAKLLIKKYYVKSPWEILLHKLSHKNIKEFRAFLAHTSRVQLMVPNITIADPHDVELWMSFGVLGKQVTSLKLKIVDEEADWLCNLLDLLPNLKYLNIKNLKNKGKILTMVYTSVISTFEMDCKRNPVIISPMTLNPENSQELKVLKKLSGCNNILTDELNFSRQLDVVFRAIPNIEARLANIINRLLSTNRNVLKTLSMEKCERFLSLLEFPCMTQLNQVKLGFRPKTLGHLYQSQFSPSFIFSEKMPKLEHFSLHCETIPFAVLNQDFLANLFVSAEQAHSVKRLSYSGGSSKFLIDPLFQAFPSVEDFQVLGTECSQKMYESLWTHGKKLRKLQLHIKANRSRVVSGLDSKFTGFTPHTVRGIQRLQKSEIRITSEQTEIWRVNPSILNLKELEHLGIHLKGPGLEGLPEDFLTFAGEFAFKLMPQEPKISIHAKHEQLEGIEKALAQVSKLSNVSLVLKKVVPHTPRN